LTVLEADEIIEIQRSIRYLDRIDVRSPRMMKLLKASLLAAVLVGGASSPAGAAMKQQRMLTEFFDDEEHTNLVGQIITFCDGTRFRSGAYSGYSEVTLYECD
jgi:hypothetical protein